MSDDHSRYVLAEDYCGDGRGTFMVTAENVPCGAEAVSCTKSIKFTIHDTGLLLYLRITNSSKFTIHCKRRTPCFLNVEIIHIICLVVDIGLKLI